jgi:hypothetical protein
MAITPQPTPPISGGLANKVRRQGNRTRSGRVANQLLNAGNRALPMGGALVSWDPGFRIIDNPGGNFQFGQAVPNDRSLVGPLNQTVASTRVTPIADQLALGQGSGGGGLGPVRPGTVTQVPPGGAMAGMQSPQQGSVTYNRPNASGGPSSNLTPPNTTRTPAPYGIGSGGAGGGGTAGAGGGTGTPGTGAGGAAASNAPKGRFAQFLSRTPFSGGGGAGGAGATKAGGILGPGSIGRGLGLAGAGMLASSIFDSVVPEQDGPVDDAISNALTWGGIGAGVGSVIPGVGTAIGGGIGLLGGGLYSLVTGGADSANKVRSDLQADFTKQLTDAGLSPEAARQAQLEIDAALYNVDDKTKIRDTYRNAIGMIPLIAAEEEQQKRQLSNLLAMQQYLTPQYDQFLQRLGASQSAFTAANNEYANQIGQMSPAMGSLMRANTAQSVMSDEATRAAYASQMQGQYMGMAGQVGAPTSMVQQLMNQYG